VTAQNYEQFGEAVLKKLITEIAGTASDIAIADAGPIE
jgi:hypothetical protein